MFPKCITHRIIAAVAVGLCLFMSACLQLTLLDGEYSWGKNDRGVTYYFHPDHTFTSYGWSNNSRDTGAGNYRIVNDSIYFTYTKLRFEAESTVVADTVPSTNDTCYLQIWVDDNHGSLAGGLNVRTRSYSMGTRGTDGYYELSIQRIDFPVTISCFMGMYDPVDIHIHNPADAEIEFHMALTDAAAISEGTQVGMKFKRRSNSIFFIYTRALHGGGHEKVKQKLKRIK